MRTNDQIYIGFARDDGREIAERICEELTRQGISVEYDNRILNTDFDISVSIEASIKCASSVVFCLTPSVLLHQDSLFRRELVFSHICGKHIVVLLFPDFPTQEIPIFLEHATQIPFFSHRNPSQVEFTSGIQRLQEWIATPYYNTRNYVSNSHNDPYCQYLATLYEDIVAELEIKICSFVLHETQSPNLTDISSHSYPAPVLPIAFSIPRSETDASTHDHALSDEIFDYFNNLVDALEYLNYRALLVGNADSGKTTILLACARDAITLRFEDTFNPVPLYVSIGSWLESPTQSMTNWLCQQTGLEKDLIEDLVARGQAMLLLDGLDQLNISYKEDKRIVFMSNLEYYLDNTKFPSTWLPQDPARYNQFLITCQYDDYIILDQNQPRYGVVTLQALERTLVTEYLAAYPELLTAIATNHILQQLLQKPFILSAFLFAYAGRTSATIDFRHHDTHLQDTQRRILDNYIDRRHKYFLESSDHHYPFDLNDIYTILGELAILHLNDVNNTDKINQTTGIWIERLSEIINETPALFVDQMQKLSLLVVKPSQPNIVYFPHPLLRNHFALIHALFILESGDQHHQRVAIRVLGKLKATEALPYLIDVLRLADNKILRWDAAVALGDIGEDDAIQPLVNTLLQDPEWIVRQKAAESLASINHPDTIQPLKAAYKDQKSDVRMSVIKTLGEVGGIRVMNSLIKALADDDAGVRWTAKDALKNIGEPAIKHLLKLINPAENHDIPQVAVQHVGEIVMDHLIAILFDPKAKDARLNVVETLKRIGEPSISPLIQAAETGNEFEKGVATAALGHIGNPKAVAVLTSLTESENGWIKLNAIQALGDIEDEQSIPILADLLYDTGEPFQNEKYCDYAADALQKIGTTEAIAILIEWEDRLDS